MSNLLIVQQQEEYNNDNNLNFFSSIFKTTNTLILGLKSLMV